MAVSAFGLVITLPAYFSYNDPDIILAETKLKKQMAQLRQADDIIARYDEMFYQQGGDPNKMRQLPAVGKGSQKPDTIVRRNEVCVYSLNYILNT